MPQQTTLVGTEESYTTFHKYAYTWIRKLIKKLKTLDISPGRYFHIRSLERGGGGGRGLGPHIKFRGKIWGKVKPNSPNKRKNLGSSVTTRLKSWEKIPILESYLKVREQNLGYLSPIFLEAKFGAPTRISEANFWVNPPPRPPHMEAPPGDMSTTLFDNVVFVFFHVMETSPKHFLGSAWVEKSRVSAFTA